MKLSELTALYSELDCQYNQAMSGPYTDLSVRNDDCAIVAGLKDGRISGFWRPMVAVGTDKALQDKIERLWLISQDIYYMDFLVVGELSVISKFLLKQGYQARPYYTQIIDKTMPMEYLHAQLRKSYKSLVAKDEKINYGTIEDYRSCHERFGGHKRPDATWDIQCSMMNRDEAFVLTDGPDAAVLIYDNDYTAYYAGGRSAPEKNTHSLLWGGIIRSRATSFELGEQVLYGDEKLVNISAFKKGFGGRTVTRLILEKP